MPVEVTRGPRLAIIGSRGYPSTYGGFETLVRRLAPHLVSKGADVAVYGRERWLRPDEHTAAGVRVVNRPGMPSRSLSTLTYGYFASRHAARAGFDAALVLNVANGFYLPLLARSGVRTAVNVDGIEWERDKWNSLGKATFKRGARLAARHADVLIADSEAVRRRWTREFSADPVYIPYGADLVNRASTRSLLDFGLKDDAFVLAVARLVPENHIELLLDAIELLDHRYPVVVVGSGENSIEERLRGLAQGGLGVTWLGHVSDQELLASLWARCGLYVHGHSVGGTNPALLQALGAGAPTLALDTPYNREVLPDQRSSFPRDAHALAELIEGVMRDACQRREMAFTARELVRERYRWPAVLDAYAQLLFSLSAAGKGGFSLSA